MLGTIVNTATIVAGAVMGSYLKRGIKPQYQQALFNAMGLCSLALGFNAFCQNMPKSHYPVLFIVSLALGALLGFMLKLDERFKRLVDRKKKKKTPSPTLPLYGEGDHAAAPLSEGLSTGILLYCIGTFSMVGPVLSALYGDNTYLYTNATLDLITSAVLATTYGIGMVWAAPVLFCWQGMFYLIAKLSADAITDEIRTELCIVGGVLIAASGLSILKIKDCKTINMLPAFVVIIVFFMVKSLLGL
ncbi:MAG: DUF554 domain-containing protein [Bacteroidaceae bacterium]|nr:DUF554 domain-containing protein [Bacteroidaceae bacterium]